MSSFRRVLVANRGEIAVRVIRACHEVGAEAVAVFSDPDAAAAHVRLADAAVRIGPAEAAHSYLDMDAVLAAARSTKVDAVHPGYGFLAERAAFARAVEDAGMVFVGPASSVIGALGDKLAARRIAAGVGVPVVPGTLEPVDPRGASRVDLLRAADRVGFPLLVKASAGGGGRGMRRVGSPEELEAALESGSREAASAFGDGTVYLEREISPARHVEVQLLGDGEGTVVALGERDCSLQRRNQKLVEEAPAPGLDEDERARVHEFAVRIGRAAGLTNAATCEFLYDADGAFWFLEVNTRLQVEHGITELLTGVDLVHAQLSIAAGSPLSSAVIAGATRAANPVGHAIEVRIAAEDPSRAFAPTPGRIGRWSMPAGPGVRVDAGCAAGDVVPPHYDNLIAKLMVHAEDRERAISRLARALDETEISGIQTTLPFHRAVAASPSFRAGRLSTGWVEANWDGEQARSQALHRALLAAGLVALGDADRQDAAGPGPSIGTAATRDGGGWRGSRWRDAGWGP